MYTELTYQEGIEFMPKVWTIDFSSDPNYFTNPFVPLELRRVTFFKVSEKESGTELDIYICLSEKHKRCLHYLKEKLPYKKEIFLYGAYNHINVVQMRALCEIKEIFDEKFFEEKQKVINIFLSQISNGKYVDELCLNKMDQKEIEEALLIIKQSPRIFHLNPKSFATHSYERG